MPRVATTAATFTNGRARMRDFCKVKGQKSKIKGGQRRLKVRVPACSGCPSPDWPVVQVSDANFVLVAATTQRLGALGAPEAVRTGPPRPPSPSPVVAAQRRIIAPRGSHDPR